MKAVPATCPSNSLYRGMFSRKRKPFTAASESMLECSKEHETVRGSRNKVYFFDLIVEEIPHCMLFGATAITSTFFGNITLGSSILPCGQHQVFSFEGTYSFLNYHLNQKSYLAHSL